MPSLATGLGWW